MKLGISYNLFDGEELLRSSILSVRDDCDHLNVVYQTVSNFGNPCSEDLLDLLSDLKKDKLIDELYFYEPNLNKNPTRNELIKRNIGLKIAKKNKCTHFLTSDSDEYYLADQFQKAKKFIEENKIEISACSFINYLKEPIYQLEGFSSFYVPFISKIKFFSKFDKKNSFPVMADPTRRLNGKVFKLFDQNDLVMHHMTLVRKEIERKFNNSFTKDNADKFGVSNNIKNYKFPDDWIDPNGQKIIRVNRVANIFNIPQF